MDQDEELARFKHILGAVFAFLISAYFSFGELKFAVWGQTAEATITGTRETRSVGRRSRPLLQVAYQFQEADGTARSEQDDVASDWPVPASNRVMVQYLPGVADSSRIAGQSNLIGVVVFLGCLGWLGVAGYRLYREANEPISRSRRRTG